MTTASPDMAVGDSAPGLRLKLERLGDQALNAPDPLEADALISQMQEISERLHMLEFRKEG